MKLKLLKHVSWSNVAIALLGAGFTIKSYKDLKKMKKNLRDAHYIKPYSEIASEEDN